MGKDLQFGQLLFELEHDSLASVPRPYPNKGLVHTVFGMRQFAIDMH